MNNIKRKRPIFHSEADFQLALACELKEVLPSCEIRLERPQEIEMTYLFPRGTTIQRNGQQRQSPITVKASFDIILIINGKEYPIELKYKKAEIDIGFNGERYKVLNDDAAQTNTKSDLRKDVYRLERYLDKENAEKGFFIFITNDMSYLKPSGSKKSPCYSFHHNFTLPKKSPCWGNTKVIYKTPLKGTYKIKWQPYSKLECTDNEELKNGEFCYTLVEVTKKSEYEDKSKQDEPICKVKSVSLGECPSCKNKPETECDDKGEKLAD